MKPNNNIATKPRHYIKILNERTTFHVRLGIEPATSVRPTSERDALGTELPGHDRCLNHTKIKNIFSNRQTNWVTHYITTSQSFHDMHRCSGVESKVKQWFGHTYLLPTLYWKIWKRNAGQLCRQDDINRTDEWFAQTGTEEEKPEPAWRHSCATPQNGGVI